MAVLIGTGVDIVEVGRMARAVERHGDRLLRRLFHEAEWRYGEGTPGWAQSLAARFAAKEAALKALGTGLRGASWRELEVERDALGAPRLRLHGRLAERAAARGIRRWHLSLSHTRRYAVAQVIAEGGDDR